MSINVLNVALTHGSRRFLATICPLIICANVARQTWLSWKRLLAKSAKTKVCILHHNVCIAGRRTQLSHQIARYLSYLNVTELDSVEYFDEKVLKSPIPVIIDFYADWCGPCQNFSPRLQAKVKGRNGAIALVKVNADRNGYLIEEFEVTALPTIIAFKDGEQVARFVGDVDDDVIDLTLDDMTT